MADLQGLAGTLGGEAVYNKRRPIEPHLDIELWEDDIDQWWIRREAALSGPANITSFAQVLERFEKRLAKAGSRAVCNRARA